MWRFLFNLRRVWKAYRSPLWKAAGKAVDEIITHQPLQYAASKEAKISFCPRCGSIPAFDRRFEEVREAIFAKLGEENVRQVDVDLAVITQYWLRKIV
jgi:hypothetical protein